MIKEFRWIRTIVLLLAVGLAACAPSEVAQPQIESAADTVDVQSSDSGGSNDAQTSSIVPAPESAEMDPAMIDDMISSSMMWFPINDDAALNISAEWPQTPTGLSTYQAETKQSRTTEEMQAIAQRFGMTGTIYQQKHIDFREDDRAPMSVDVDDESPVPIPDIAMDVPLMGQMDEFVAFGEDGNLHFYGSSINYYRKGISWTAPNSTEQDAQTTLATEFVASLGLLPENYVVETPHGSGIEFFQQIDGIKVERSFASVQLDVNNEVIWFTYDDVSFVGGDAVEVISAESAWQQIVDSERITPYIGRMHPIDPPEYNEDEFLMPDEQFWVRSYAVGEQVTLYTWLNVYESVDGSTDIHVLADDRKLNFDGVTFDQISAESANGSVFKITGTIAEEGDAGAIDVQSWEAVAYPEDEFEEGVFEREDGNALLVTPDGRRISLPNAPEDLASGKRIGVFGYTDEAGQLQWRHINGIEYGEGEFPAEPPEPIEAYEEPPVATSITIDSVELRFEPHYPQYGMVEPQSVDAASSSDVMPVEPMIDGPQAETYLPTWYFLGTADNGMTIELKVLAVP